MDEVEAVAADLIATDRLVEAAAVEVVVTETIVVITDTIITITMTMTVEVVVAAAGVVEAVADVTTMGEVDDITTRVVRIDV